MIIDFCKTLGWVRAYTDDFMKRFLFLLGYDFKTFEVPLCLSILDPNLTMKDNEDDNSDIEMMAKVMN